MYRPRRGREPLFCERLRSFERLTGGDAAARPDAGRGAVGGEADLARGVTAVGPETGLSGFHGDGGEGEGLEAVGDGFRAPELVLRRLRPGMELPLVTEARLQPGVGGIEEGRVLLREVGQAGLRLREALPISIERSVAGRELLLRQEHGAHVEEGGAVAPVQRLRVELLFLGGRAEGGHPHESHGQETNPLPAHAPPGVFAVGDPRTIHTASGPVKTTVQATGVPHPSRDVWADWAFRGCRFAAPGSATRAGEASEGAVAAGRGRDRVLGWLEWRGVLTDGGRRRGKRWEGG